MAVGLPQADVDHILDYICSASNHRTVHFLWRPFLRDPDDDMVLEVAVESESHCIVTYHVRDFEGIGQFGIRAITPQEFLRELGELP